MNEHKVREAVGTHSTWFWQRVRRGEVLVGRRCRRLSESEWCWLQSGRSTRGRGCARGITPSPRVRRKLSAPLICQINNSAAADPPTSTWSDHTGLDQKAMRTANFRHITYDFCSSPLASWMAIVFSLFEHYAWSDERSWPGVGNEALEGIILLSSREQCP